VTLDDFHEESWNLIADCLKILDGPDSLSVIDACGKALDTMLSGGFCLKYL